MKLNVREIAKPTLILLIICVVVTAALAGTNALTESKILEQAVLNAEASRSIVLPQAEKFLEATGSDGIYFVGETGGSTCGFVFETESSGYGGSIRVMTGIDLTGKITGVTILSQSETPGLGANAIKPQFTDQYQQEVLENGIKLIKNAAPKSGEVEALTGATITSSAVTVAVNTAVEQFYAIEGRE